MTKQTTYMVGALILAMILGVVTLIALDSDTASVDRFINFAAVTLVPTIVALWAGNRADKAGQLAEKAAENAEQAVHNTNGRMGQLIQATIDNGGKVDVDEYSDVLAHQDITVPPEQAIHTGNPTVVGIEPAFSDFDVTKREDI